MRLSIGIAALILVLYVCFEVGRMGYLIRVGKKIADGTKQFERPMGKGSPRLIFIGDSLTVGVGATHPSDSIAGRFGKDFPDASIVNVSKNGWKVRDVLEAFPSFPDDSFDAVIFTIGANDILRKTPMPEFLQTLDETFAKAKKLSPNVFAIHSGNIGLAPFFPWPLSRIMTERTRTYREEYRKVAAKHGVVYVNFFHEKKDDTFAADRSLYASDGIHLSSTGYERWYTELRAIMDENGVKF